MRIKCIGIGKKFETRWIFRDISIDLLSGESVAITGSNGSGKSTLLQILSNSLTPSKGKIEYFIDNEILNIDDIPHNINYCAPYVELIEEFTLQEHLEFHAKFRQPTIDIVEMMKNMGYPQSANQVVREFSSGMKQRLRLALTFYFDSRSIFLDEPTSNLDESGIAWYLAEIQNFLNIRSILIASNQRYEYDFCQKTIQLNS